jgi:hypothetical protein
MVTGRKLSSFYLYSFYFILLRQKVRIEACLPLLSCDASSDISQPHDYLQVSDRQHSLLSKLTLLSRNPEFRATFPLKCPLSPNNRHGNLLLPRAGILEQVMGQKSDSWN